jgi:Protein of unknown function (DUF4038)/Putative collagen-binding domain of a collagenase
MLAARNPFLLCLLGVAICAAMGPNDSAADPVARAPKPTYPLKVSANRRYLVDQHDEPFLLIGDSPQSLIANASVTAAADYFAARAEQGFNCAFIQLVCDQFIDGRPDGATRDGIVPFKNTFDFSAPNPPYWQKVDAVIQTAAKYNICCMLAFFDTSDANGKGTGIDVLTKNGRAKCYDYGAFLGNRYKDFPNIIWVSGNDFNQTTDGKIADACVQAIALGIKSIDANHIHTLQMSTPGYAKQGTCDADAEDNGTGTLWSSILSLDWVYSWPSQYDTLLRAYASSPVMPTFLGEAQYEYQTVIYAGTPLRLRLQHWWTMTCGATGVLYGNGNVTSFADTNWKKFIVSPGVTQLGFLRALLSSMRWYDLIPDISHRLLISGLGNYDSFGDPAKNTYATAAIASDGTAALIYAPTIRTMTINLSRFTRPVSARWFDPSTGHYHPIPDSPFSNSGTHNFRSAGKNGAGDEDWVLLLSVDPGPS